MSLDFDHYFKAFSMLGQILECGLKKHVNSSISILILNYILELGLRKTCSL